MLDSEPLPCFRTESFHGPSTEVQVAVKYSFGARTRITFQARSRTRHSDWRRTDDSNSVVIPKILIVRKKSSKQSKLEASIYCYTLLNSFYTTDPPTHMYKRSAGVGHAFLHSHLLCKVSAIQKSNFRGFGPKIAFFAALSTHYLIVESVSIGLLSRSADLTIISLEETA